jgi:hypothetical protein
LDQGKKEEDMDGEEKPTLCERMELIAERLESLADWLEDMKRRMEAAQNAQKGKE